MELLNIANTITRAYLVPDGRELEFLASETCEHCSMIELEIPEDYHQKKNYSICLETVEAEPVYEPIVG